MNKGKLTLTIVVLAVAIVMVVKYLGAGYMTSMDPDQNVKVKGNPNAPIKIIEFIDFECPACAAGSLFLKKFMEENPDKIYLKLKYFPLDMHKHSLVAATYAECSSRQGKFWEFHDYILKEQEKWSKLDNARPVFDFIAGEIGLDKAKLTQCVEDPKSLDNVMKNKEEGRLVQLKSTPTYFVNGEMVVGMNSLQDKLKVLTGVAPQPK